MGIRDLFFLTNPDACGYKWYVPKDMPYPSSNVAHVPYICVKREGHNDDHESNDRVTTPNLKK